MSFTLSHQKIIQLFLLLPQEISIFHWQAADMSETSCTFHSLQPQVCAGSSGQSPESITPVINAEKFHPSHTADAGQGTHSSFWLCFSK